MKWQALAAAALRRVGGGRNVIAMSLQTEASSSQAAIVGEMQLNEAADSVGGLVHYA
jgi:hypothetical protein